MVRKNIIGLKEVEGIIMRQVRKDTKTDMEIDLFKYGLMAIKSL